MRIPFDEAKAGAAERARGEANAVATARRALELGINHIDTAQGYGNSERLVGLALRELGRGSFHVTTKAPVRASRDVTRKSLDESLARLGVDRIDVLDLHGINSREKLKTALAARGPLTAVREAIEQGIVSHAAFSSHAGPEVIVPALETGAFSAVSLLYGWTYRRNEAAVARAAELDVGVLILSPAEKGGMLFRPPPALEEVCRPFSPLALSHRWALSRKGVTTLAIGPACPAEFDAHASAADGPDDPAPEEAAALARWEQAERQALGATRCTVCFRCLPCPEDVAIPEILRLRNLGRAFGMTEFGAMRYNLLGNGGDWFPGQKADRCNRCGQCLPRCPERLDIPALLDDTHRMLAGAPRKRLWSVG
jgi:predicted aldo/keto reductase-like oxidoreductase